MTAGSPLLRVGLPLFGLAIAAAAAAGLQGAGTPGVWAGFAVAAASPLLVGRGPLTRRTLTLRPGVVETGFGGPTLRARAIRAFASAPWTDAEGTTRWIAAASLGGARPILFIFDEEEELDAFRSALGLARDRGASFQWPLRGGSVGGRVAFAGACVIAALAAAARGTLPPVILVLLVLTALAAVGELAINALTARSRSLLTMDGATPTVTVAKLRFDWRDIAFAAVESGEWLRVQPGSKPGAYARIEAQRHRRDGLSPLEAEFLAAYLGSEARRLRGEGVSLSVPAFLAYGGDVSAWISRLDGVHPDRPDYRGVATSREELLRVLDAVDAPPDARIGAARVLLRVADEQGDAPLRARVVAAHESAGDALLAEGFGAVVAGDVDALRRALGG